MGLALADRIKLDMHHPYFLFIHPGFEKSFCLHHKYDINTGTDLRYYPGIHSLQREQRSKQVVLYRVCANCHCSSFSHVAAAEAKELICSFAVFSDAKNSNRQTENCKLSFPIFKPTTIHK